MSGLPPPPFALTRDEKHSQLWLRLKTHLTDELDDARRLNDRTMSEIETARLRGRIDVLKGFIALGEDRPDMTGNQDAP